MKVLPDHLKFSMKRHSFSTRFGCRKLISLPLTTFNNSFLSTKQMSFNASTSPREPSEFFFFVGFCAPATLNYMYFLDIHNCFPSSLLMSSLSVWLRICPPPQQSLLPVLQNHLRCHLLQEAFPNTLKSILYTVDYKI